MVLKSLKKNCNAKKGYSFLTGKKLIKTHYLSAPALSRYTILNMKKVEYELISDTDIYVFFKKGMAGRVSYICERYSKDNNKYLKSYSPKQESKHITYLDANNLYSCLMPKCFQQVDLNG